MRIRYHFFSVLLICALALAFSACKEISEGASGMPETTPTISVMTESTAVPESENLAEAEAISTSEEEKTEIPETQTAETDITEASAAAQQGIPETSAKNTETTLESTSSTSENPETTTAKTETTSLTLQYESPPETTVSQAAPSPSYGSNSYKTVNFREQKGFWITYLEYMTILKNKSESSFRNSIGKYFDNISDLGFNTVYVQVRAFGDAYYDSGLFPSGEQFNGTIGTDSSFDALQIMIDCAHSRGMSIHAWVNPMRLMNTSQIEGISDSYQIKKWYNSSKYNGTYIVKSGDKWYLNPAYDAVTDLIASGISEIVSNYDVDGIQIDDYFYPTTAASFDSSAYSASGGGMSLSDWRISNVNRMVKKLYKAAHSANSSVLFGISPQGSVENDYKEAYADVRTWCSQSGYCDYILPQVYFGFENASLPYESLISQWSGMVTNSGVKLVIGLAAYKIGAADNYAGAAGKNEWLDNDDIISRQMKLAKNLGNYGGVALYRYDSVFNPTSEVAAQVSKEIQNIKK